MGPPPLGATGTPGGEERARPPVRPSLGAAPRPGSGAVPRRVQRRGGPARGTRRTGLAGDESARRGAEPGWRPRGARRRRLQPRFKGQRGAEGSLPTLSADPSAAGEARGRLGWAPSKFAFCPSAAGSTQRGTRFLPVFLRLPPPPPPSARPVKATQAAGVARGGVVSLRPAEGTPFRVLPPFPGGVRTAHRGRRRVCGARGEAPGL